jgi:enoyl-CoA hydratase/carnithine racemase
MPEKLETLIVERRDGVVTVTMNRPARKNAANGTMWQELLDTFDDVAADRDVRVMVLTGAGGAFCSGADLGDASNVAGRPGDPFLVQMRALGQVALRLHQIPKPTIAKVGGVAAGAGMSMALGCDLVVSSASARFSQIFSKRGLSVDFGASWLLATPDRPPPGQGARLLR